MNELAEEFRQRTKLLALAVIRFYQTLPKTDEARILGKQLLRAATSTAANYRAATRGRSGAEFYAKLSIAVEEADETCFWLELLKEAEICSTEQLEPLITQSEAIRGFLAKSRSTLRARSKRS
ncbi:four helix bundle protein [Catalinimonas alkaloidigena]|uniref:four helix bundle protein n=1 Tax=Catalinimonas alkaloidigena TaxID=1075417 RepID=UPI000B7CFDA9|nr:four helix bundle protein [Catalinimonas alkaloidigena]